MFVQPPAPDALQAQAFEFGTAAMENGGFSPAAAIPPNDTIRRFMPPGLDPGYGTGGAPGGGSFLNGLLGQLGTLLQQLGQLLQFSIPGGSMLGGLFGGSSGTSGCGNGEQYFQNATGSSIGDPHLSFNGTTWDSMANQPDLLHSDSFPGGYQVSTQATAPAQNGVTYNRSATVTSNYGMTSVSLDNAGNASILQGGAQVAIAAGQTIDLGNGQAVTRTQNGLQITANNGAGGQITTTLTINGQGVDVQNSAANVDLGGALVEGKTPLPSPIHLPRPIVRPYAVPAEAP